MTERPIFVVGCPRSGTTLLRDLLRSHPRLSFPHESGGLPGLYRVHGDPRSDREARLLAADFLGSHSVRQWNPGLRPADLERGRTFAAVVTPAYELWARGEGKPRWGDKTPLHVLEIPQLVGLFPTAQFVHLVRDGRDVALSLAGKGWGQRCAYTAAVQWRRCVEAGLADGRPLGASCYHELSYEELLAAPESTLRRLCAFLDEDFVPALLRPSRIPLPAARPPQWAPGLADRLDAAGVARWKRELPADEEVVFESVAGDLLRRLGYETHGETRALGRLECARWEARDLLALTRWRLTAWDRVPRARTSCLRAGSRLLVRLGRTRVHRATTGAVPPGPARRTIQQETTDGPQPTPVRPRRLSQDDDHTTPPTG